MVQGQQSVGQGSLGLVGAWSCLCLLCVPACVFSPPPASMCRAALHNGHRPPLSWSWPWALTQAPWWARTLDTTNPCLGGVAPLMASPLQTRWIPFPLSCLAQGGLCHAKSQEDPQPPPLQLCDPPCPLLLLASVCHLQSGNNSSSPLQSCYD